MENNYLNVVYSELKKPLTFEYPKKLVAHLIDKYNIKPQSKLLEPGCGRGEFLYQFKLRDIDCYGFDLYNYKSDKIDIQVKKHDALISPWPYPDNFFDVIYNKSFIEHFYYPEKLFSEFLRVLKPGGKLICLTPDYSEIFKTFYDDCTHRTPFTMKSLEDINLISGLKNIEVEKFIQLPHLWKNNRMFLIFSKLAKILSPNFLIKHNKYIRFSKEIMLLSKAEK